jgi:hypothetical protein
MFPKLPKAGSGLRDYRRYDMHFDGNGNTLIVWLVAVVNGVSPGSATSLNSVFVAVRGSNSDIAYTREWIIGIFMDSQQGARNMRNKLSPSLGNVVVSGANFISPGKSEKDPLTLASKLASGDLGGNTLALCITDQSSHRGAAYLVDMLLKYYPDETKDSVLELTAKKAFSLYAQFVGKLGGKAVQDSRAAFLLLSPHIQSAMRDATAAELIEHRDALRMPANGRFVRAAGLEASVQGLGRSEARSTAVGAAIEMGWDVRCALRIPDDEEITPEALQASGSVIASEMGLASAAEYRSLVAGDAAGTLSEYDQEKFRLWHEALQGAGFANAAEYRHLADSDAAGTLLPAKQEKFTSWRESRIKAGRSGGDNDADLLDAKEGFETADGPEEKQIAAEKLANAVAYCETRHELRSKSMIETKKVSRELAAKTREKTNLKTLR